jgi:hypothetical protein
MYNDYKKFNPMLFYIESEDELRNVEEVKLKITEIVSAIKVSDIFNWKKRSDSEANLLLKERNRVFNKVKREVFYYMRGTSSPVVYDNASIVLNWINIKLSELEIDNRIKGKLNQIEIEEYFMKLSEFNYHKGKVEILNKMQIMELLQANFYGFEPRQEIKKLKLPKFVTPKILTPFIYEFYLIHCSEPRKKATKYIEFLKNNFSLYDNTSNDSLKSNWGRIKS